VLSGINGADFELIERLNKKFCFSFEIDNDIYEKPSLFIFGRQDNIVGYNSVWNILDNYPRATLAILDVAGNALQIEQEELFNYLFFEWLDRIENKK